MTMDGRCSPPLEETGHPRQKPRRQVLLSGFSDSNIFLSKYRIIFFILWLLHRLNEAGAIFL